MVILFAIAVGLAGLALIAIDAGPAGAAFPGENGRIAFERDSGIWVMERTGAHPTQLTSGADSDPSFSADGKRIAFTRNEGDTEIWVMDADGGNQMQLTDNTASDSAPRFSPDGTHIAFASNRGGNFDIYLMDVSDPANPVQVSCSGPNDFEPAISPDGTLIAATRNGTLVTFVIADILANGCNAGTALGPGYDPTFSPNGDLLAFYKSVAGNWDIYVMPTGGGAATRVTTSGALDWAASFSPDGTQIAWWRGGFSGSAEIYAIDYPSLTAEVNLTMTGGADRDPDWGVASRSAKLDNAADVFPGSAYENAVTAAVPDAHGNVTTPAGGGNSPLCTITVQGLLPQTEYRVYVDTNGITVGDATTAGPLEARGTFTTNKGGSGKYQCSEPIGDLAAVFVNDVTSGMTVLVSTNVTDL